MNKKAFTLIEMLITIVIVGILSAFVIVQVNDSINAGKDVKRKADIELLANAVVTYSAEHYSSKPVTDIDGCTIGGDCGSTIEDSLRSYLPTLPNDPDSGIYYTYQSDGNDCTISASLSSGDIYQYSCANDISTLLTPINGVCGTSANDNFYLSSEITNPCTSGTVTNLVGSGSTTGYFTWTCPGVDGGSASGTCTANLKVNGVCGVASQSYIYTATAYAGTYCSSGAESSSPAFPSAGSTVNWTCNGINEGAASGTCVASRANLPSLVYGYHTEAQCTAAGGYLTPSSVSGYNQCQFYGASCPSGWYRHNSWRELSCPVEWTSYESGGTGWFYDTCWNVGFSWHDTTASYTCTMNYCNRMSAGTFSDDTECYPGYEKNCSPTTAKVGCY
ncbi:type II secretion system GspH family protein [bacterium]|jgi:prepilin-type N-terminal cleavage/methylation domain-containing protein|nr:type II secretion system GspH family protein [bacterium]